MIMHGYGITVLTAYLVGFTKRFISIRLILDELLLQIATKMTDTGNPNSNTATGTGPDLEYPGIPRWVKVSGIIVIVVVVVLLVATALGFHNPSPGVHGP